VLGVLYDDFSNQIFQRLQRLMSDFFVPDVAEKLPHPITILSKHD
jgi:hypothetical protein